MEHDGIIIGNWSADCGHTFITTDKGLKYSLRSLQGGSFLVVEDYKSGKSIGEYYTPGEHSCHIRIYMKKAVISDYSSGTLTIFELDDNGIPCSEAKIHNFGEKSRIHSSWVSPTDGALIVVDLGEDKIYRSHNLADFETYYLPSGCGPRHCAFSKAGNRLYVSTEFSDEVLVLDYPSMELIQRCEANPQHPGGGSHIEISPDGNFLYVSCRLKNDGIATFRINELGLLIKTGYQNTGAHPRHFCLSKDGKRIAVACRDTDSIEIFEISPDSGVPDRLIEKINTPKPVFVAYSDSK